MLLSIRNAQISRGSEADAFRANVSELLLNAGEFLAILGPSGCGKSTLLDLIGLLLQPEYAEEFELHLGGESLHDVQRLSSSRLMRIRRQHMGYILQSGGLIASLSVRENIMTAVRFAKGRHDQQHIDMLVESLGLSDLLRRRPSQLSGGQRQRVAIARALVHKPSLILADEPTAAVDHELANGVCQALRSCAGSLGSAVVMVTHNRDLASSFADRIIDLGHVASSPVQRISSNPSEA